MITLVILTTIILYALWYLMYINTHLQYQITEHFMSVEEKYKIRLEKQLHMLLRWRLAVAHPCFRPANLIVVGSDPSIDGIATYTFYMRISSYFQRQSSGYLINNTTILRVHPLLFRQNYKFPPLPYSYTWNICILRSLTVFFLPPWHNRSTNITWNLLLTFLWHYLQTIWNEVL